MNDLTDNSIPISALQHWVFCPRQCALIHLEREWEENVLTAKGRAGHEKIHQGFREFRRGKKQITGLRIGSKIFGIHGQIDVLELDLVDSDADACLQAFGLRGVWRVYPVEFKHGAPKRINCDRIQLCAQVLCLEEMLGLTIDQASLFYHRIRKREEVAIDTALRELTEQTIRALHEMFTNLQTPLPEYAARCKACSLNQICMPQRFSRATVYRRKLFTPQEAE